MTTSEILLDSYAWIEFFLGTNKGSRVKELMDSCSSSTSLINIAELSAKYAGLPTSDWEARLDFIQQKSSILPLTIEIVSRAGRTRQEMRKQRDRFGLADAIIYETARQHHLSLVSGDPHFQNLPDVIFLE